MTPTQPQLDKVKLKRLLHLVWMWYFITKTNSWKKFLTLKFTLQVLLIVLFCEILFVYLFKISSTKSGKTDCKKYTRQLFEKSCVAQVQRHEPSIQDTTSVFVVEFVEKYLLDEIIKNLLVIGEWAVWKMF